VWLAGICGRAWTRKPFNQKHRVRLAYNTRMFDQLEDAREKPAITRGTVITFLLMIFLLGIVVGAQLMDLLLRLRWSVVGIGYTFLVCVLLWKLSAPPRKAFKSVKLDQDIHVE
jgi:hypothetical protein